MSPLAWDSHDDCLVGDCIWGSRDCPAGRERVPYHGWDMASPAGQPRRVDWQAVALFTVELVLVLLIIALLIIGMSVWIGDQHP